MRVAGGHVERGQRSRPPSSSKSHISAICDGVGERLGVVREERGHLLGATSGRTACVSKRKPLGVVHLLAGADAQQHVVRVVVVARGGSGRRWSPRAAGPSSRGGAASPCVDPALLLDAVLLHLEVEAVLRRRSRENSPDRCEGLRLVAGAGELRDLAATGSPRGREPLAVLREQLLVDARAVVEALEVPDRDELDRGSCSPASFVASRVRWL